MGRGREREGRERGRGGGTERRCGERFIFLPIVIFLIFNIHSFTSPPAVAFHISARIHHFPDVLHTKPFFPITACRSLLLFPSAILVLYCKQKNTASQKIQRRVFLSHLSLSLSVPHSRSLSLFFSLLDLVYIF